MNCVSPTSQMEAVDLSRLSSTLPAGGHLPTQTSDCGPSNKFEQKWPPFGASTLLGPHPLWSKNSTSKNWPKSKLAEVEKKSWLKSKLESITLSVGVVASVCKCSMHPTQGLLKLIGSNFGESWWTLPDGSTSPWVCPWFLLETPTPISIWVELILLTI